MQLLSGLADLYRSIDNRSDLRSVYEYYFENEKTTDFDKNMKKDRLYFC
ncbi:MAG: hypothetical protein R2942_16775 [Ignavibacteria bacterium]